MADRQGRDHPFTHDAQFVHAVGQIAGVPRERDIDLAAQHATDEPVRRPFDQ